MENPENSSKVPGGGSGEGPAPRGRPRSETARRAVLEAALELCQRDGYQELTMKGIADEAGVGRQTVYRWWPSKQDVLIEVLGELPHRTPDRLFPDTGGVRGDVEELLAYTFELTRGVTGRAIVGLMADAQGDAELSRRLQESVIGPRREVLRQILERGVRRGELSEGADASLDLAVDFAFGVMWYRLLSRHAPVDDELAADLAAALEKLLSADGDEGARGEGAGGEGVGVKSRGVGRRRGRE
ncbi:MULTISPECIES: TetR/AcrR family transcriptional regulator [unclassified Streptomyces]|uniref:TetR/AcrR family transcriptional regulator n=1 Tax=Streptomyces sp. NBC_00060 TaxID=2975636 RepID=A0AAU2H8P3_9ACTN